MYCSSCGKPLPGQVSFCPSCGAAQQATSPSPSAPPAGAMPPAAASAAAPFVQVQKAPSPAFSPPGTPSAPRPGVAPVSRSLKTGVDTLCGIVFLLLGLAAIGIFGFFTVNRILAQGFQSLFPILFHTDDQALYVGNICYTIIYSGYILGTLAGLIMVLGGIFSLVNGKGKKPVYAAIVLMLFTLLCDVLSLMLMYSWSLVSGSLAEVLMSSLLIYVFEVAFVLLPTLLLPFKKMAKRRRKDAIAFSNLSAGANAPATPPPPPK